MHTEAMERVFGVRLVREFSLKKPVQGPFEVRVPWINENRMDRRYEGGDGSLLDQRFRHA